MSKSIVSKSTFIPPPLKGLNLISGADQFERDEARQLDNYLIFDSGIRQAAKATQVVQYSATTNVSLGVPYVNATGTPVSRLIYFNGTKAYRYAPEQTSVDITGAASITNDVFTSCIFNKHVLFFNGVDTPLTHDMGAASNVANFSATGPTVTTLIQATGFKHRLYIVQKNSTSFWYGAVGAYAGTFTEYDLGDVLDYSGQLLCVFNWSFNQGLQNEELFCALTTVGELLVYSGDYPGASNWYLICRAKLPIPTGTQPFVKVSGDVWVVTNRGVIPLSSVIAGNVSNQDYYSISRKIKNQVASDVQPVVDYVFPFVYFASSDKTSVYVLNYEKQAWSKLTTSLTGTIKTLAAFPNSSFTNSALVIGTGDGSSAGTLYSLDLSGYADSSLTYTWAAPYDTFGEITQKQVKLIRVLGLNYGVSGNFVNTAKFDFDFSSGSSSSSKSTAVSADTNAMQELAPSGIGRRLGLKFSRAGNSGVNEKNEIQGCEILFESGGVY